jgi:hypothetical protein
VSSIFSELHFDGNAWRGGDLDRRWRPASARTQNTHFLDGPKGNPVSKKPGYLDSVWSNSDGIGIPVFQALELHLLKMLLVQVLDSCLDWALIRTTKPLPEGREHRHRCNLNDAGTTCGKRTQSSKSDKSDVVARQG